MPEAPIPDARINMVNTVFLAVSHVLAVVAIVYMATVQFSWWTVGLAMVYLFASGVSITGGYHRLFAHTSYRASALVRGFYLAFGAAAVQNSALKWASDHRTHHSHTDTALDPYSITRGFWWSHIGWVLFRPVDGGDVAGVSDLERDSLVRFQNRYYVLIAIVVGAVIPFALGSLWGDALGALLVVGFLRMVLQWHSTFSINSLSHMIGSRPYERTSSARDNPWLAPLTLGEAYHNYHHKFPSDYRNGHRWFDFDPTKWWVWGLARVGQTWGLRRVATERIDRARQQARAGG